MTSMAYPEMNLLWRRRCREFWLSVAPYFRYVLSGGLGVFLILFVTVGGFFYARLIESVDEQFPAAVVGALILLPLMFRAPVRTFLREPDVVFLTPVEGRMGAYVRAAQRYSFTVRLLSPLLVWTVYWPVCREAAGSSVDVFVQMVIVIVVWIAAAVKGSWAEMQMHSERVRSIYTALRLMLTACSTWTVLAAGEWMSLAVVLPAVLAYLLLLRLSRRTEWPWDQLIENERRHKASIYTFLSAFVDVEERSHKVRRRAYLEPFVRWIPHSRRFSWIYFYYLIWMRSETGGIFIRLGTAALLMIVLASDLWLKAGGAWLFVFLCGLQLRTLQQVHRHDIWLHLYPLPVDERERSARYLMRSLLMAGSCLLVIVFALSSRDGLWSMMFAGGCIVVILLSTYRGIGQRSV